MSVIVVLFLESSNDTLFPLSSGKQMVAHLFLSQKAEAIDPAAGRIRHYTRRPGE